MKLFGIPQAYKSLPRSIHVLFFANVVNNLGNFVAPFLALFLTDKLGLSKAYTGWYIMLATAAAAPGALLGGKLADHFGRKRVLLGSRLSAALTYVACGLLGKSPLIPWLLIAGSFLRGVAGPAIRATTADLTRPDDRPAAFSLLYLGANLGYAFGPMLAGFLYRNHVVWLFLGDALTTLVSVALIWRYVGETLPTAKDFAEITTGRPGEQAETGGTLSVLLRRPVLVVFALAMMLYSFVYVQTTFALPIQLREVFPISGARLYGLLMSLAGLVVVVFTGAVTRWSQRFTPALNVAVGGALYALGFGMLAWTRSIAFFVLSTLIWVLGEILVATNEGPYIANHAPVTHRGRFNAVYEVFSGAGYAVGPYFMGRVIDRAGVAVVWSSGFFIVSAGTLLVFLLWAGERGRAIRTAA